MDFGFKKEEEDLIREVRAFIKKEATPEMLAETRQLGQIYGGPEGRKFIQKFAAKGWLTPNWPKEFGGMGASEMVTYIIRDEMAYARVPSVFVAAHMAGPTILRVGNEELRKNICPGSPAERWSLP
jgi:alkylation response protein AidB-like acyl-CoA dehydrogenase